MKKEIFFLLLMSLFNVSIGSIQTLDSSNINSLSEIQTSIQLDLSSNKSNSLIQKDKVITQKKQEFKSR
jgi:hypothetical protein